MDRCLRSKPPVAGILCNTLGTKHQEPPDQETVTSRRHHPQATHPTRSARPPKMPDCTHLVHQASWQQSQPCGLCGFPLGRRLAWGHPDHRLRSTHLLPLVETKVVSGRIVQGSRNFKEVHIAMDSDSTGLNSSASHHQRGGPEQASLLGLSVHICKKASVTPWPYFWLNQKIYISNTLNA